MQKWGYNMRNYEDYSIEDNVQYINQLLNDGLTMKQIEEDHYNVSERVIVKRLSRRGYKRAKDGNRLFVLVDNKADIKPHKATRKPNNTKDKATNTLSAEEVQKLKDLINNYDDIMYMLNMYSKCNTNNTQHINNIEDIQIIQTCNTKQRMFRVDVEVLEQWNEFCEEYKHIKVQSLISSALQEYINKYSRK